MPTGSYDLSSILHLPVIFVSGVPGSGKQTIAQTISTLTGYVTIRPEDLEREEAAKDTVRGRVVAEKLAEDEEVPEVAAARLKDKLSELGKPADDIAAAQIVKEAASKMKTVQKRFGGSIIMVNSTANPTELTASLKEVLSENLDYSRDHEQPPPPLAIRDVVVAEQS